MKQIFYILWVLFIKARGSAELKSGKELKTHNNIKHIFDIYFKILAVWQNNFT